MLEKLIQTLEDHKAQDIVSINLEGKCNISDYMIIASGTSQRHLQSLGKYVQEAAVKAGVKHVKKEGSEDSDWVLIDLNSFIIHLFRPETRSVYDLESMWADIHESGNGTIDTRALRQQTIG